MPKAIKQDEKHALPGAVSWVKRSHSATAADHEDAPVLAAVRQPDGPDEVELIYQEDYGLWPVCPSCKEQVQPALFSMHSLEHDAEAKL